MAKFKVGDKVRILDGSNIEDYEGAWVNSMKKYINSVHAIGMIDEKTSTKPRYLMKDIPWVWDERGLELVTKREPKHKFKVGDKIIGNKKANDRYYVTKQGWIGIVTAIFDNEFNTFNAIGPCDNKDATFTLEEEYFDLYGEPQKIVITNDGKTTIAALYNGKQRIKDAKAVCAPNDKFDFNYGASLALDRLTGFVRGSIDQTLNNEGEYFTGKVRCVRVDIGNQGWLTKGKVYTFVNGYSVDDLGDRLPLLTQIHSVKELNDTLYSDFEEVKFDWDGFKAGEFNVIVNRKNIDRFLKECDEHKIKWTTVKATKFNPIKDLDDAPPIIKFLVDAEQTEKCDLEVENGKLKYSFKLDMRDETVIYD